MEAGIIAFKKMALKLTLKFAKLFYLSDVSEEPYLFDAAYLIYTRSYCRYTLHVPSRIGCNLRGPQDI